MSGATEDGVVEQPTLEETEQRELDEMMEGYGRAEQSAPPAGQAETSNEGEQPTDDAEPSQDTTGQEQAQTTEQSEAEPTVTALFDRLEEFKAEIRANSSKNDPDAVRKLYGEIGNINRTLKDLDAKVTPQTPPVKDALTAALEDADRLSDEFPEMAGPLVAAMRELAKAQPASAAPSIDVKSVDEQVAAKLRKQAVEALTDEHPDFDQVMRSEDFDKWVKSKPAAEQDKIRHTENPILAARFLSQYKESVTQRESQQQQGQQQKRNRLENAIAPKGVPAPPAKSKLTEDEEIMAGYNKGAPRPIAKRG